MGGLCLRCARTSAGTICDRPFCADCLEQAIPTGDLSPKALARLLQCEEPTVAAAAQRALAALRPLTIEEQSAVQAIESDGGQS